jgi:hypothetical protein
MHWLVWILVDAVAADLNPPGKPNWRNTFAEFPGLNLSLSTPGKDCYGFIPDLKKT